MNPVDRPHYAVPRRLLPPPRRWDRARRRGALIRWGVLIGGLVLVLRFDVSLMRRMEPTLRRMEPQPLRRTSVIVNAMRQGGEFSTFLLIAAIVLLVDRRGALVSWHTFFAIYLAFNAVQLGKILLIRERPLQFASLDALRWDAGWGGVRLDVTREAKYASFPSGHSATAFAGAAVLAWFYPRWRLLFWMCASAGVASRVIHNVHWPGDCLAGAMIGYACGWLSLRCRALTTPRDWFRRQPAASGRRMCR